MRDNRHKNYGVFQGTDTDLCYNAEMRFLFFSCLNSEILLLMTFVSMTTGAPYAGASAQRMGAAALRKFQPTSTPNKAVSGL